MTFSYQVNDNSNEIYWHFTHNVCVSLFEDFQMMNHADALNGFDVD